MHIILLYRVQIYIQTLSSRLEISRILQYIERQSSLAHLVREPVSKALGAGLYEMRPGPHRLVFIYHGGKIVVVHAFRKKSQKTPHLELLTASRARDRYLLGETE